MIVYVVVTGIQDDDSPIVRGVFTTPKAAEEYIVKYLPKNAKKCEECGDYWEHDYQWASYEPFEIDNMYGLNKE